MTSLVFSRVLTDPGACLERAFDESFTGIAAFEPRSALVRDTDTACYVSFENGIPTRANVPGSGAAGGDALPALADAAPCRVELRADATRAFPANAGVDPGELAHTLDRPTLADAYPGNEEPSTVESADDVDALDAFLADEERVTDLKERARAEAASRADEWGFDVTDDEARR